MFYRILITLVSKIPFLRDSDFLNVFRMSLNKNLYTSYLEIRSKRENNPTGDDLTNLKDLGNSIIAMQEAFVIFLFPPIIS